MIDTPHLDSPHMHDLRKLFPAAPYAYFVISHINDTKQKFLSGEVENPTFSYHKFYSKELLEKRRAQLQRFAERKLGIEENDFVSRRLTETALLLAAKSVQEDPSDVGALNRLRDLNYSLYGRPEASITNAILQLAKKEAANSERKQLLWDEVVSLLALKLPSSNDTAEPSHEVFMHYKRLFYDYAPWLLKSSDDLPQDSLGLTEFALSQIGAESKGWRGAWSEKGMTARVSYEHKRVFIGHSYKPLSLSSLKQTVVHEVYGHVNRHVRSDGNFFETAEAEGFGVFLEQLLQTRFSHKRTLRYLAIALGWGTIGRARTFREVYEVLWRCAALIGGGSLESAKKKAFTECVRAFRGGNPVVPGAVFTKDILYHSGNVRVWKHMESRLRTYEEFVKILEGKEHAV